MDYKGTIAKIKNFNERGWLISYHKTIGLAIPVIMLLDNLQPVGMDAFPGLEKQIYVQAYFDEHDLEVEVTPAGHYTLKMETKPGVVFFHQEDMSLRHLKKLLGMPDRYA